MYMEIEGKKYRMIETEIVTKEVFIVTKFVDASGGRVTGRQRTKVFYTHEECLEYIKESIGEYIINKRYVTEELK